MTAARRDEEDDRAEATLAPRRAEELDELCDLVGHDGDRRIDSFVHLFICSLKD